MPGTSQAHSSCWIHKLEVEGALFLFPILRAGSFVHVTCLQDSRVIVKAAFWARLLPFLVLWGQMDVVNLSWYVALQLHTSSLFLSLYIYPSLWTGRCNCLCVGQQRAQHSQQSSSGMHKRFAVQQHSCTINKGKPYIAVCLAVFSSLVAAT